MAKDGKKKGQNKKVPAVALPAGDRPKIPIHRSESMHSFLVSFAYIEDAGPAGSWSADGHSFFEAMQFLGQRQRDPTATTGDARDHYQRNTDRLLVSAIQWLLSRPALQDSADYLWSFRLTGEHRLWGLLVDDVFYVLWNDPQHAVYITQTVQEKGKRK